MIYEDLSCNGLSPIGKMLVKTPRSILLKTTATGTKELDNESGPGVFFS
jgi:hypothetical protein